LQRRTNNNWRTCRGLAPGHVSGSPNRVSAKTTNDIAMEKIPKSFGVRRRDRMIVVTKPMAMEA